MNQLRIIAGKWRSRKIYIPDEKSVRPTPDRIRETLFNWLAADISGAHCLDLFAGSGALGFEALSRGASSVLMVDSSAAVMQHLQQTATVLKAENIEYRQAKIPGNITLPPQRFELVFLDPPFNQGLLIPTLEWLQQSQCLSEQALIYIEVEKNFDFETLNTWKVIKEKETKHIRYGLITAQNPT